MSAANLYNKFSYPVGQFQNSYSEQAMPVGAGLDVALEEQEKSKEQELASNKEALQGGLKGAQTSMSAGGSLGQTLTGASTGALLTGAMSTGGLTTAGAATGGAGLAAGLALSYMEQKKQAEAAEERAIVEEAQNRKIAIQNAINAQIGAARMLGV